MSTPTHDRALDTARRGLRTWRWATVLTTAGTGVVVVALASRVGDASAVLAAVVGATAFAVAIRRSLSTDRRWRRARSSVRTRPPSVSPRETTSEGRGEDRNT